MKVEYFKYAGIWRGLTFPHNFSKNRNITPVLKSHGNLWHSKMVKLSRKKNFLQEAYSLLKMWQNWHRSGLQVGLFFLNSKFYWVFFFEDFYYSWFTMFYQFLLWGRVPLYIYFLLYIIVLHYLSVQWIKNIHEYW